MLLPVSCIKNYRLQEASNQTTTIATLQVYSTPVSVFDYKDQVTDGKLLLSIMEVESVCHNPNTPIQIQLSLKNLTSETLLIPSEFKMAISRNGGGGNIIPQITDLKKIDIYSIADTQFVDSFRSPPDKFSKLVADENYKLNIDFLFPGYLVGNLSEQGVVSTPTPGSYFIRFIYAEYEQDENIWFGAIGSNRIEICIL